MKRLHFSTDKLKLGELLWSINLYIYLCLCSLCCLFSGRCFIGAEDVKCGDVVMFSCGLLVFLAYCIVL
jgi:hypothetical protein